MKSIESIKNFAHDTGIGLVSGLAVSLGMGALSFLFSLFSSWGWLALYRSALCLLGALGLLLVAGLLLSTKEIRLKKAETQAQWKRHFHIFTLRGAVFCISITVLIIAVLLDYAVILSK